MGLPIVNSPAGLTAPSESATAPVDAAPLQGWAMLWTLLGVFAGGLALNLTPCVYPMIPITVSFFGGRSARDQPGQRQLVLSCFQFAYRAVPSRISHNDTEFALLRPPPVHGRCLAGNSAGFLGFHLFNSDEPVSHGPGGRMPTKIVLYNIKVEGGSCSYDGRDPNCFIESGNRNVTDEGIAFGLTFGPYA